MSAPNSEYLAGSTEPWTVDIIVALAKAIKAGRILELGTFEGRTTKRLSDALPDSMIVSVEMDPQRVGVAQQRLRNCDNVTLAPSDAITFLQVYKGSSFDLIFIDDDHTFQHVAQEVALCLPLLSPKGLVLLHDVIGPFNLDNIVKAFGGIVVHSELLHAAGGLGIIQRS